jgi:GNAT superfamily N-acetyltransferase
MLTYRKTTREDLPKISIFRKSYFPYDSSLRSHEPEYYDWKCYQNPAAQGEIWVAEDGDAVVGMKSMIPKRMKILGQYLLAAETGDTFTHPDHQRKGIFSSLFKAADENGIDSKLDFIYGSPNENSLPAYEKRLNYAQIPLRLRMKVKPVYVESYLKSKLRFTPLVKIGCRAVELVSKAMSTIGLAGGRKSEITISRESTFSADIDDLWQSAAGDYDVMLVRSQEFLRWRYVENPDKYSIFIARDKRHALLGYLVSKLVISGDKRTGYIADFFTEGNNPAAFKTLLSFLLADYFRQKVNFAHVLVEKNSQYGKVLRRAGFISYRNFPLICRRNEIGNKILSTPLRWHFTLGDTDNI